MTCHRGAQGPARFDKSSGFELIPAPSSGDGVIFLSSAAGKPSVHKRCPGRLSTWFHALFI